MMSLPRAAIHAKKVVVRCSGRCQTSPMWRAMPDLICTRPMIPVATMEWMRAARPAAIASAFALNMPARVPSLSAALAGRSTGMPSTMFFVPPGGASG